MARKIIKTILLAIILLTITSCVEEKNYYDAIPRECMALVRINSLQASPAENEGMKALALFLQSVPGESDGVDPDSPVFLFETNDGTLGACAKISSASKFEDFLNNNSATILKERKNSKFALVNHSYLVGYNDVALMVVGPIVASSESQVASRLSRYLEMDSERGIGSSEVFALLSESKNQITMQSRLSALPKQFTAPFLLGTPTGTSPYDVIMNATVEVHDSILSLKGNLTSENLLVKQSLERTVTVFRPFDGNQDDSGNAIITLFANVDGKEFINLLQANKDLNSILNNNGVREKLQTLDGNMVMSITPSKSKDDEVRYTSDVKQLDKAASKETLRYKLNINLDSSEKEILNQFLPFFTSIKKIEYSF